MTIENRPDYALTIEAKHRKYRLKHRQMVLSKEITNTEEDLLGHLWIGFGYKVIFSHDPTPHGLLGHVSVSCKDRHPTWEELISVRDQIFPADIDCMMMMPRTEDYINISEHCFHIWETPQEWGIH